jgi:hypothetical protein
MFEMDSASSKLTGIEGIAFRDIPRFGVAVLSE